MFEEMPLCSVQAQRSCWQVDRGYALCSYCSDEAGCRIPEFGVFNNTDYAHLWGILNYFKDVLVLQVPIF